MAVRFLYNFFTLFDLKLYYRYVHKKAIRKNKDSSQVVYIQLAHNYWDLQKTQYGGVKEDARGLKRIVSLKDMNY